MLQLKRKDVADNYDIATGVKKDLVIHTPGYSGRLSNINAAGASFLAKSNLKLLQEKQSEDNPSNKKRNTQPKADEAAG